MKTVYFLKPAGMDGPIKIGCSRWPESRLKALDIWSPFPLELLTSAPGENRDERNLHWAFREQRLHGEWFTASPKLYALIDGVRRSGTLPPLEAAPYGKTGRGRGANPNRNPAWKLEKAALTRRIHRAERRVFGFYWRGCQQRPKTIAAIIREYQHCAHVPPPSGAELAQLEEYLIDLARQPACTLSRAEQWAAREAAA